MRELRTLLGNLPLTLGLLGVLAIVVVAVFGQYLAPHDPQTHRLVLFYPDRSYRVPPIAPDALYPLGTDTLGRDILSRLLWGAQLTVTATLLAVGVRMALGVGLGLLAGWRRGVADSAVLHATNALGGFPQLMLALLLVVALRDWGLLGFVIALSVVGWSEVAQFVRAEVVRLRVMPYVEAARAMGARTRQLISSHVLRNLAPQLVGLAALEAGAVLILLAELGFIGFFISGGTFFTDGAGRPILPVRDRAPEWGQMLAGARAYTFSQQWIAFIPAVVVVLAVFAFNLFGEGLRAALDPFGRWRLSPRTLGVMTRGFGAVAIAGSLVLGAITLSSTQITFEDGLALAHEAAERESPGAELIAAVVRFRSDAYDMHRPEKLNYYFRVPGRLPILRVGFVDADRNAMEVKHFDDEDGLEYGQLAPLDDWEVQWERAMELAERSGGTGWRTHSRQYVVRVALQQFAEWGEPIYRVLYSEPTARAPRLDVSVDARTGRLGLSQDLVLARASARAVSALGGPVDLISVVGGWGRSRMDILQSEDPEHPASMSFTFREARGEQRLLHVLYQVSTGLTLTARLDPDPEGRFAAHEPMPSDFAEIPIIFRLAEESGGRDLRLRWEAEGLPMWSAFATAWVEDGQLLGEVTYRGRARVVFRVYLETGEVERLDTP